MKILIGAKGEQRDARCNNALYQWDLASGYGMSLCEPSPFFPDQCKYMTFLHFDHLFYSTRQKTGSIICCISFKNLNAFKCKASYIQFTSCFNLLA